MRNRVNHTEVVYTSRGVVQNSDVILTSQPEALSRPVWGPASCLALERPGIGELNSRGNVCRELRTVEVYICNWWWLWSIGSSTTSSVVVYCSWNVKLISICVRHYLQYCVFVQRLITILVEVLTSIEVITFNWIINLRLLEYQIILICIIIMLM